MAYGPNAHGPIDSGQAPRDDSQDDVAEEMASALGGPGDDFGDADCGDGDDPGGDADGDADSGTEVGSDGRTFVPAAGYEALWMALGLLGLEYRYNLRSADHELRGPWLAERGSSPAGPDGWRPVTREIQHCLMSELSRRFRVRRGANRVPFTVRRNTLEQWLDSFIEGDLRVDPVVLWLDSLPDWDGTERVGQFFQLVYGVVPGTEEGQHSEAYLESASWSMFGPLTARAYVPGSVGDTASVIAGKGGVGKSSGVAWLIPEGWRPFWFSDGIPVSTTAKSIVELTAGMWLVEFSEMQGARRADVERIKSLLSSTGDTAALKWEVRGQRYMRRWMGVGTANLSAGGFLPDDANNRRFLVVRIPGSTDPAQVRATLDGLREQLWAEAVAHVKGRERDHFWTRMVRGVSAEQDDVNDEFRGRSSHSEDIAAQIVEAGSPGRLLELVASALGMRTVDEVSARVPKAVTDDVADELARQGWHKHKGRVGGSKPLWRWYPPGEPGL